MIYLAFRQLVSRPQQTVLTFVGITLGTAAFIILSGMLLGMQEYIIDRLISNDAHITVSARDEILDEKSFEGVFFKGTTVSWDRPPLRSSDTGRLSSVSGWFNFLSNDSHVIAYSPRLTRQIILASGSRSYPVTMTGVDAGRERQVSNIERDVTEGQFVDIGRGGATTILGEELVQRLGLHTGQTVQAVNANGERHPLKIVGVLRTGIRQLDAVTAYTSLQTARQVSASPGETSSIAIRLSDVELAAATADTWSVLSRDRVLSWEQKNESIMNVFKIQDATRVALTFVIILVVAFSIYNILNMVVNQKKKEIAILRSMGYEKNDIINLFLIQGLILGSLGAIFGILAGLGILMYMETLQIAPGAMGRMHISYSSKIFVQAASIAMGSAIVASIIPARAASRLTPIDVIRESGS